MGLPCQSYQLHSALFEIASLVLIGSFVVIPVSFISLVCIISFNLCPLNLRVLSHKVFISNWSVIRGLPRGLSDKRHCVKMWRQFDTKVPTADRIWHERGDNLRKRQSIFHFDKATTALFFFDGDMTVTTWQGQCDSFGALLFAFMVDQLYKY